MLNRSILARIVEASPRVNAIRRKKMQGASGDAPHRPVAGRLLQKAAKKREEAAEVHKTNKELGKRAGRRQRDAKTDFNRMSQDSTPNRAARRQRDFQKSYNQPEAGAKSSDTPTPEAKPKNLFNRESPHADRHRRQMTKELKAGYDADSARQRAFERGGARGVVRHDRKLQMRDRMRGGAGEGGTLDKAAKMAKDGIGKYGRVAAGVAGAGLMAYGVHKLFSGRKREESRPRIASMNESTATAFNRLCE